MSSGTSHTKEIYPLDRLDDKQEESIRFVSFNINGVKTLGNYFPWNKLNNNFDKIFQSLKGDIISLQELKLSSGNLSSTNLCNLRKYKSFISLPKLKKGYSGVGLFVRIPEESEDDKVKYNLNVVKAEEGITGYLRINNDTGHHTKFLDLDDNEAIGGYVTNENYEEFDEELALQIDREGRAVVVELASGLVIFSLYCPANSMQTEEGERLKNKFMELLIKRCQNLIKLGKQIMVLGDINISLDLIDQADGINERLNKKLIKYSNDGEAFEKTNHKECVKFKRERFSRMHLSKFVFSPLNVPEITGSERFLYDTTRVFRGRTMEIYTCWNTLNGSRQTNFGSRIDLILTTEAWKNRISKSSHWPFLMGSDHCPIFTDFLLDDNVNLKKMRQAKLSFEAKAFYKIIKHHDISSMFKAVNKRKAHEIEDTKENEVGDSKATKITYQSRKTERKPEQRSIQTYFDMSIEN
ncbi:Class II abasic (AP) endonuclease [Yamadazyma tenuis]|uniref:Class II abasic (AP) endonuclease n=1 Tax=Candida tenuis TaxID=2315449 RepID=UPI00279C2930|nr:Class II abasic (AP) endonuclease [Yamadazyma tenuis]